MDPLVSVVVPCFNYGNFIEETINSILVSSYKNIEIIIVDDGSTDSYTIDVIKEISFRNSLVKVISTQNNGLPAARNIGIENSSAPYILTLDADDKISEDYISKSLKLLQHDSNIPFTFTLVQLFGTQNKVWRTMPYDLFYIKFRNVVPATILMRKTVWEKVGGYDESLRDGYEDWEFVIRMAKYGFIGKHIKEPLFLYRKHNFSMLSYSKKKHWLLFEKIRTRHTDIYRFFYIQFIWFCFIEIKRRIKMKLFTREKQ